MSCEIKKTYIRNGEPVESGLISIITNIVRTKYPHSTMEIYNKLNPKNQIVFEHPDNYSDEVLETVINHLYDSFHTSEFKEDFGDWINDYDTMLDRLHKKSLEPLLIYDKALNKHYYRNKYGDKVPFPPGNDGLRNIYKDNKDIREAVKAIARSFYEKNKNEDFRIHKDDWISKSLLKTHTYNHIYNRANALMDLGEEYEKSDDTEIQEQGLAIYFMGEDLQDSLAYIDEWTTEVNDFFNEIGFKLEDGNIQLEENLEDEENGSRSVVKKPSIEQNSKDAITANVKLMLSMVSDHKGVDKIFGEPRILDHGSIWNKLVSVLTNITPTIDENGNIEDTFELQVKAIEELSRKLPYFRTLLNVLSEPTFTESNKSQFAQAFHLTRRNLLVDELTLTQDNNGNNTIVNLEHKDVTDVNTNHSKIIREWGSQFKELFVKDDKVDEGRLNKADKKLEDLKKVLDKHIVNNTNIFEDGDKGNYYHGVLEDLGIYMNIDAYKSYLQLDKPDIQESQRILMKLINNTRTLFKSIIDGKIDLLKQNVFKDQSIFTELAKEENLFLETGTESNVVSGGKMFQTLSNPTFVHNSVNSWKQNRNELENKYASDPELESSPVMKYLLGYDREYKDENTRIAISNKRIKAYKIQTYNVFQNKKTEETASDPVNSVDMSKIDAIGGNISRALQFKLGKKQSTFGSLTPADKATSLLISHGFNINTLARKYNGQIRVSSPTVDIFYDYIKSDFERMHREFNKVQSGDASELKVFAHLFKNKDGVYSPYDSNGKLVGNAFKFQLFSSLNQDTIEKVPELKGITLFKESGAPIDLDVFESYEKDIKEFVKRILHENIDKTLTELDTMDFFRETNETTLNNYFDSRIWNKYKTDNKLQPQIPLVADYVINSLINDIEYSKMFTGAQYHYKNAADFTKRVPATYTDGMYLRLTSNDDLKFKVAIVENVEIQSQFLKELKESYGKEIADKYKKIDSTDAQAWITPTRWKFLLERLGLWHDVEHQNVYDKMMGKNKEKLSTKEMKLAAQPLKGVYYSNNGSPMYLKYSQAVLYPELIKGTGMQRLYDSMKNGKVDEVVTMSGIKVGANTPNVIHDSEGNVLDEVSLSNTMTLDNRGWKLQQNLPTKNIKNTLIGSQIQKNILMGLHGLTDSTFIINGEEKSRDEVYKSLLEIVGAMSDHGFTNILEDFGVDENHKITNPSKLYKKLIDEAKKRNVDKNLITALQKEISILGIPQSYKKFINMFASAVNSEVVRMKTSGGSFIQVANFGFKDLTGKEQSNIKWLVDSRDLKPPLLDLINKVIKPGQILIPASYINQYLNSKTSTKGKTVDDLSASELKEMIDSEAFKNIIGYRIPNQALASNDALEIVGILPDTVGDSVVAYTEIPVKTGSDFDIDKMYLMLPSLKYDETKGKNGTLSYIKPAVDENGEQLATEYQPKEVLNNMLIEHYKAILTHPEVGAEVMTPIDFKHVEDHIKHLFKKENYKDLELMNPLTQINIKYSFLAGKAGIGQTANMLVDHARGLFTDNYFYNYKLGWGNEFNGNMVLDRINSTELSERDYNYAVKNLKDTKKSYKISHTLSAFLNAFVDIAKDEYVTRGNWATQTSNAGFTMIRAGVHPYLVNAFIGQPIIKKYIDFIINNESKLANNEKNMVEEFKKSLLNDDLIEKGSITVGDRTMTYLQLAKSVAGISGDVVLSNYKNKYKVDESIAGFSDLVEAVGYIQDLQYSIENKEGDVFDISRISLRELESQIKEGGKDTSFQLSIFNKFREILDLSKEVGNNMKIMKTDTDGMGKDLSSRLIKENLFKMMRYNEKHPQRGTFMGIRSKMRDPSNGLKTTVGVQTKNVVHELSKILKANPQQFLMASKGVEDTFNIISYRLQNKPLTDQKLADKMYNSFYSYVMSNFDLLKNEDYVEDLFVHLAGDVRKQLAVYKDSNKENKFLEAIEITEDGNFNFLKINNASKNKDTKNNIYAGWLDLMKDNEPLATKLAQYAYYQSGFETNINEFFSSIPHELMVENNIEGFIRSMSNKTDGIMETFIEQFFQHRHDDKAVVKKIFDNKIDTWIYDKKGFILKEDQTASGMRLEPTFKPPYVKINGNDILFKLVGYDSNKRAVYFKTSKKGLSTNNGRIYEYTFDKNKESKISTNNLKDKKGVDEAISKVMGNVVRYTPDYFIKSKEYDDSLNRENDDYNPTTNIKKKITKEVNNINEITNHSGGAIGADTQWDIIGNEYGFKNHNHYYYKYKTPKGNKQITQDELQLGLTKAAQAAKATYGFKYQFKENKIGTLLARNYQQVTNSDAIFAVTPITKKGGNPFKDGRVALKDMGSGGTSYAIEMAIQDNKDVYIFDDGQTNNWYQWDYNDNTWNEIDTPILTRDFAGIGSRNITEQGKQAIRDVYRTTLNNINEQYGEVEQDTSLENTSEKINIYSTDKNGYETLSNFAERPFKIGETTFNTVEAAFQTAKFQYLREWLKIYSENTEATNRVLKQINTIMNNIITSKTGIEAKKLGRTIIETKSPKIKESINTFFSNTAYKNNWEYSSSKVMKNLITISFEQNLDALQILLSTGNSVLTHNQDKSKWKTLFPKLLMEVREELNNIDPLKGCNK